MANESIQAEADEVGHNYPHGDFTEICTQVLSRLAFRLSIPLDRAPVEGVIASAGEARRHIIDHLIEASGQLGIILKSADDIDSAGVFELVREGFPVVALESTDRAIVWEQINGNQIETSFITDTVKYGKQSQADIREVLHGSGDVTLLVGKRELACHNMSSSKGEVQGDDVGHDDHKDHLKPQRRLFALLRLDIRDIVTIAVFAFGAGILTLATPLTIESLVNVVSWGTYLQPLFVLGLLLFGCLGIAGILRILQSVVVEMIQRRQFVRIIGDLSHRFARANRKALAGIYPREFANRLFDIMTIQKASAVLLLDGINILLTTILGLLLLAFYHPYLLGFDLILVISMVTITYVLGRGGVRTAIEESATKYKVAHWLQDVIASPSTFKINGGSKFAIARANRLTTEYLRARASQFRVVIRQVIFAIGLQVIASTALLGLGGWLVIQEQLTLGQLVASELVVTVVVGAFAKAGKSLEKFYDLLAGIDKVGYLLDIKVDPKLSPVQLPDGPADLNWDSLDIMAGGNLCHVPNQKIEAGSTVALWGDDFETASNVARAIAGLIRPEHGLCEIGGFEAFHVSTVGDGGNVGYSGEPEIIHATIAENVSLGRNGIGESKLNQTLRELGLWKRIANLPQQTSTMLQTGGYPLSRRESTILTLARATVAQPKVLVIDGALDDLDIQTLKQVWSYLTDRNRGWTLIVATSRDDIRKWCNQVIEIGSNNT